MKYDMQTIQNLRKEKNPTDQLLTLWSVHNHTILELFILLSRMHHYQAMTILKPFIESKYHELINRGEENMQIVGGRGLARRKVPTNTKDFNIGQQNFNQMSPHIPVTPKVLIDGDNSLKILNQPGPSNRLFMTPSNSNNLLVASPLIPSRISPVPERVNELSQRFNGFSLTRTETTLPQISYEELERATDGWNDNKILGKGGFGTVYRGNKKKKKLNNFIKQIF